MNEDRRKRARLKTMLRIAFCLSCLWAAIDVYLIWVPADGEKIRRITGGATEEAAGLVNIEGRLRTLTGTFEGNDSIPNQEYKVTYTFSGTGQIKKELVSGSWPFKRTREARANFTAKGSILTYTEIEPNDRELFRADWEQFAILSDGGLFSMEWQIPLYSSQGPLEGPGADPEW